MLTFSGSSGLLTFDAFLFQHAFSSLLRSERFKIAMWQLQQRPEQVGRGKLLLRRFSAPSHSSAFPGWYMDSARARGSRRVRYWLGGAKTPTAATIPSI